MSALTKKKYVFQETINNFTLPELNQLIVKVKSPRGNNLHDVETPSKEEFIVSMPTKFRKTVWVKRGDYLIVEPIEEGNKVKAQIVQILNRENIKYFKSEGVWPKEFDDPTLVDEYEADGTLIVKKEKNNNDLSYMPPSESSSDDDDNVDGDEQIDSKFSTSNLNNRNNLFNNNLK